MTVDLDDLAERSRRLIDARRGSAEALGENPAQTAMLDELEAGVRECLWANEVDLSDPVVANALLTVSGAAQQVLVHCTNRGRQQDGFLHFMNVVHSAALLAARRHVDRRGGQP